VKLRWALVVLLLVPAHAQGAFEASRTVAPGAASVDLLTPRMLAWLANPATLAWHGRRVGAGFARPYGVPELDMAYVDVVLPGRRRVLAFGVSSLGQFDFYRETDLSAGVAVRLRRTLSLGAVLHLLALEFGRDFGKPVHAALDLGVWHDASARLAWGLSAADLGARTLGASELVRPVVRAALAWRHSPGLGLRAGAEHRDRWVFALGETVLLADQAHLRADLATAPVRLSVGLRLRLSEWQLDFIYRDHAELGGDPVIELGRRF
jgi:hypothetical protein